MRCVSGTGSPSSAAMTENSYLSSSTQIVPSQVDDLAVAFEQGRPPASGRLAAGLQTGT